MRGLVDIKTLADVRLYAARLETINLITRESERERELKEIKRIFLL